MENKEEKTVITLANEEIIKSSMTSDEMLLFLKKGAMYKDFKYILMKEYPDENVGKILSHRLPEISGKSEDSIARSVRNWMKGTNIPRRETLFQICFALELDMEKADKLIALASESRIHFRNPQEIIYAYCLQHGLSWQKACELSERLIPLCGDYKKVKFLNSTVRTYTDFLKREYTKNVRDENDLEDFIIKNRENFSELHLTAYTDFLKMITYLQDPDKDYDDSYYEYVKKNKDKFDGAEVEKLLEHEAGLSSKSVASVVEEFMRMSVPSAGGARDESGYSYIQKVIRKNWPSENTVNSMKNQDIDVSRKVMILLHILTEEFEASAPLTAGEDDQNFWVPDTIEMEKSDADELMEVRKDQLDLFLDSYGMNKLDFGNPFDCMVLYALRASYCDEYEEIMSEKLEELLRLVFEEDTETN